jgi:DNA repair protein RadC
MNFEESSKSYLIASLPVHERPRERLLKYGSDRLRDVELLAIILKTGPHGKSTLDLARELLQHFDNSLLRLAQASPAELEQVHGIGSAKAAELKATFALTERLAQYRQPKKPKIITPEQAADYLREMFRGKQQEEIWVVLLDSKNQLIRPELITIGLLDQSQAHAREVFRSAIHHTAARIILAHNHPSGDPTPSQNDITSTRKLVQAGEVVGIPILDHIVIGLPSENNPCDYYSFREHELLA